MRLIFSTCVCVLLSDAEDAGCFEHTCVWYRSNIAAGLELAQRTLPALSNPLLPVFNAAVEMSWVDDNDVVCNRPVLRHAV